MPKRYHISKSTFLKGVQCPKALFLLKYRPDLRPEVSEEQQAIFDQGTDVGVLAQKLFPEGVDAGIYVPQNFRKSLELTRHHVLKGTEVIYEAGFAVDRLHCFVDILVREGDSFHAYEVKSSTDVKEIHLWDAAFQYYVMKKAGLTLSGFSMIVIDTDYEREGDLDIQKLFKVEMVLDRVAGMQEEIGKRIAEYFEVLDSGSQPQVDIGPHCGDPYDCDFIGHCWQHVPGYSVFNIARIGSKAWDLYEKGVLNFEDIPVDYPLNDKQWQQVLSEIKKQVYVDRDAIREFIGNLKYPLYFLDFETFQSAVPMFGHSRPYQQIPFQYSCHVQTEEGGEVMHREFLAESVGSFRSPVSSRQSGKTDDQQYTLDFPGEPVGSRDGEDSFRYPEDPRIPFMKSLIADVGTEGDIIVFNQGFESGILSALARDFPEKTEQLGAIRERLVDLMVPFRERQYYVPEMQGSFSIKKVLPALVPEFSYEGMPIAEGSMASLAFRNLYHETDEAVIRSTRENLLAYCKLDTQAMVEILKVLSRLAVGG